jgi:hypothetical protein
MDAMMVGIDVSKDRLDVAVRPTGESFVFKRTAAGIEDLVVRLKDRSPALVQSRRLAASRQWLSRVWLALAFSRGGGQSSASACLREGSWQTCQDRPDRCCDRPFRGGNQAAATANTRRDDKNFSPNWSLAGARSSIDRRRRSARRPHERSSPHSQHRQVAQSAGEGTRRARPVDRRSHAWISHLGRNGETAGVRAGRWKNHRPHLDRRSAGTRFARSSTDCGSCRTRTVDPSVRAIGAVRVSFSTAARACAVPCLLEPWSRHATTRSSNDSATDSSPLANPSSSLSLSWPASSSQSLTLFCEIDAHGSHSPLDGKDSRSFPQLTR